MTIQFTPRAAQKIRKAVTDRQLMDEQPVLHIEYVKKGCCGSEPKITFKNKFDIHFPMIIHEASGIEYVHDPKSSSHVLVDHIQTQDLSGFTIETISDI